jgi:hypothetical protein
MRFWIPEAAVHPSPERSGAFSLQPMMRFGAALRSALSLARQNPPNGKQQRSSRY